MSSSSSAAVVEAQPRLRLRPRHYIALAVSTFLYARGGVPRTHLAFALLSLPYTLFLSKAVFPLPSAPRGPPIFGPRNRALALYMLLAAVVGLLLPAAYIAEATYRGDAGIVDAAGPHLFLLCGQIFMEGISFSEAVAMPLQVFVPVCFNAGRLPVLWEWLGKEMARAEEGDGAWRAAAGTALAALNFGFWCFNLFGFLVPVFLPRVFRRYYSAKKA